MRSLYISYDGITDPLGRSQVLPYLSGLSKKGIQFSLLSFEKKDSFLKEAETVKRLLKDSNIEWYPLFYTKNPPVFSTLYDIRRMIKTAEKLHRKYDFQVVHCRSYIAALAGLYMKKRFGTKFIFDMRGFWADERTEGGLWNLRNPIYKAVYNYFKRKERQFFEFSDCTISLTHAGGEEILHRKDLHVRPLTVIIPCCTDLDFFDPALVSEQQKEMFRTELKIEKDTPLISYQGSTGTWYLLEEMLSLFGKILNKKPEYRFLFITPSDPKSIAEAAEKSGVPIEKLIIREAKREEMPALLSLCLYSVFFIKPGFSKKASSPVKQGEAMAMGIPVICNAGIGDTDKIISDYKSGYTVSDFSDESLKKAAEFIASSGHIFDPEAIRKGAEDYFSLEKGVEKYHDIYSCLLSKG